MKEEEVRVRKWRIETKDELRWCSQRCRYQCECVVIGPQQFRQHAWGGGGRSGEVAWSESKRKEGGSRVTSAHSFLHMCPQNNSAAGIFFVCF